MSALTETRMRQLCEKLLAATTEEESDRLKAELRVALAEHTRSTAAAVAKAN